ncbi:MAG TPA: endonuclease/exonuclease/phosphatase family protein [Acidimicrobiia bacterium]
MPELTIVTFNAHAGMRSRHVSVPGTWSLRTRPDPGPYDLVDALCGFDADVIVVQESYRPDEGECAVERAAAARSMELFEAPFGPAVVRPWPHLVRSGTGVKGLAVLTALPARRLPDIPVPRVPGDPARSRCALHVELGFAGGPVELVAVHLTSRLPHGPPIQLARLRGRLPGADRRAVVAGDLNFWGPPAVTLLRGWHRTLRGRTWPSHRPHSQIDHVLVRSDVEVLEARVLPDVGSDHRPVRVRLRLP